MKYLVNGGFFIGLIFSLLLGIRQVSLFGTWVRLEVNILIFVAILRNVKANLEIERIKYFIIQSIGSSIFLIRIILGGMHFSLIILERFIRISLILKLGIAPLHSWFVNVTRNLR